MKKNRFTTPGGGAQRPGGVDLCFVALTPPSLRTADYSARENPICDCVFAASWCRSVGMSWTVELRPVKLGPVEVGPAGGAALNGPVVEWICSGMPTQLPAPERQTAGLLGERDLLLFPDKPVEAVELTPRARSRRLIGYVTRDPEVIALALTLADVSPIAADRAADGVLNHPMILAARWIQAGYSADAAASWITAGVTWPEVANTALSP